SFAHAVTEYGLPGSNSAVALVAGPCQLSVRPVTDRLCPLSWPSSAMARVTLPRGPHGAYEPDSKSLARTVRAAAAGAGAATTAATSAAEQSAARVRDRCRALWEKCQERI